MRLCVRSVGELKAFTPKIILLISSSTKMRVFSDFSMEKTDLSANWIKDSLNRSVLCASSTFDQEIVGGLATKTFLGERGRIIATSSCPNPYPGKAVPPPISFHVKTGQSDVTNTRSGAASSVCQCFFPSSTPKLQAL